MEDSPDVSSLRVDEDEEQHPAVTEKLACYRCRQRKVKCDRGSPCGHCVKAGTQYLYISGPKPRERQQRVMVSKIYDSKLDEISRKLDELSQRVRQLSHEPTKHRTDKPFDFIDSINMRQEERCLSFSLGPTPLTPSLGSTPHQGSLPYSPTGAGVCEVQGKAEYERESSLFAHSIFASQFL
ncbi:hypothetical protein RU639_013700 [Aspergillus parasiticus]